jgi:hypothetical protein
MTSDERIINSTITGLVDEINRIVKDKALMGDAASLWGTGINKVDVYWSMP